MATTALSHRNRYGLGKQSAEGTAQGTPLFSYSLYGGGIKAMHDEKEHEVSSDDDLPVGDYIARGWSEGDAVVNSDPDALGLILACHMGADTVTGSGTDRIHTMIRAATKPFVTAYQMRPGIGGGAADRWERLTDGFIRAVELQFEAGEPMRVLHEIAGKKHDFNVAAPPSYAFTVVTGTDVFTATGHTYVNTDRVRVTGASLPAPLIADTDYYVRDVSGATFKLAATSGGAAIDITTAGTGGTVTATIDARITSSGKYLTMVGATLNLDIDVTPAVTQFRRAISGTIRSEYADVEWEQSDEFTGTILDLGKYSLVVDLSAKLENYELLSQTFHGAKTGSSLGLSSAIVNGSADFLFAQGPVADTDRTLKVTVPNMRWVAEWPDFSPGGGPVMLSMTGKLRRPATGVEGVTMVLKSGVTAYL